MSALETALIAIGGNALLLAILGFLAKAVFEKILARDSRRFEIELQGKADVAIENLKSELQIKSLEHQVRFSRLHEKRAEVIAELHGLLVLMLWESELFLSPIIWAGSPDEKTKYNRAMEHLESLCRYFGEYRIYLPPPVCEALEKIIKEVRSQIIGLGVWVNYDQEGLPDHASKQKHEALMAGWNVMKHEIPKAQARLEDEFRSLLGERPRSSQDSSRNSRTKETPDNDY